MTLAQESDGFSQTKAISTKTRVVALDFSLV
jgi:hypothetical protein